MHCAKCNNPLKHCICADFDERIKALEESPYFAIDWDTLREANKMHREQLAKQQQNNRAPKRG